MSTPTSTPTPTSTSRPGAPSTLATVSLVAGREINMRLRSKSFLISTAILMLASTPPP